MKPSKPTDGYETEAEFDFWGSAPWIQELREVLMTVYDPPPNEEDSEQQPAKPAPTLISDAYREAADD